MKGYIPSEAGSSRQPANDSRHDRVKRAKRPSDRAIDEYMSGRPVTPFAPKHAVEASKSAGEMVARIDAIIGEAS